MRAQFAVENAGCASCGALIGDALTSVGAIESIDIDESADLATVRINASTTFAVEEVDRVLEAASGGSGHAYRVRPGSWLVDGSA